MQTIGRYRVLRPLGEGGMGEVFLARDPDLDRDVALKLLHGHDDRSKRERFRTEARSIAALRHPGIVTIYEIAEHEGRQYIAMEYLPGRSMRDRMVAGEDVGTLLRICQHVTEAVAAAHAQGILHRDIKPENVVVCDDTVKVVDFGLARRLDAPNVDAGTSMAELRRAQTMATAGVFARTLVDDPGTTQDSAPVATKHTVYGTPAYMAPEVLMGDPATQAADTYALGVMLYECIARARPFGGATLHELIANVIDGELPAPLDHPLGALIAQLLDRDPARRPALADVAEELRAFVLRTPIVSIRTSSKRIDTTVAAEALLATERATPPRRWPLLLVPATAVAIAVAFVAVGGRSKEVELRDVRVAVEPISTAEVKTIGGDFNATRAITDSIAVMLGTVDGVTVVDDNQVDYVVRGKLVEDARSYLHAELDVVVVATGEVVHLQSTNNDAPHFGSTMVDLGQQVARVLQPAAADLTSKRGGQALYRAGRQRYEDTDWARAMSYLELAVQMDDSLFEAWFTLAMVRSWLQSDQVETAIEKAYEHRPRDNSTRARIIEGALHYFRHQFAEAIALLTALEAIVPADQRAELFYFLGEAYWHDGQFDRAYSYLSKVKKLQSTDGVTRFRPMAIHCGEYAAARRRSTDAMVYSSLVGLAPDSGVALIDRDYAKLIGDPALSYAEFAASNGVMEAGFREYARIIVGQDGGTDGRSVGRGPADAIVWDVARAIDRGAIDDARRGLDSLWQMLDKEPPNGTMWFVLESLGEVLLANPALTEDAIKLVAYQRRHLARKPPPRSYERFAWLLVPLTKDASAAPTREHLTTRENKLADAATAELRGDRATATKLLEELVADPTSFWDYPERAALVRNYKALGRTADIDRLCADSMEPPIFRVAFRTLRATCREAGYKNRRNR